MLIPADKRSSEQIPKGASPTGGSKMGLVYAEIELISTVDIALYIRGFLSEDKIKRIRIRAMVDSGSYMMVITDHIRQQLDLPLIQEQVFRLADDSEIKGEVVGPVEVHFENRSTTTRAVVSPAQKRFCWVQFHWRIWTW